MIISKIAVFPAAQLIAQSEENASTLSPKATGYVERKGLHDDTLTNVHLLNDIKCLIL